MFFRKKINRQVVELVDCNIQEEVYRQIWAQLHPACEAEGNFRALAGNVPMFRNQWEIAAAVENGTNNEHQ